MLFSYLTVCWCSFDNKWS